MVPRRRTRRLGTSDRMFSSLADALFADAAWGTRGPIFDMKNGVLSADSVPIWSRGPAASEGRA